MYSRRSNIEEIRNKKKAYIFIFLTIVSVLLLFFFGLPAVVKFAALITEINKSSVPVEINDTTPPPPPRISSLPIAVKEKNIEINGNTEPGIKVIVYTNEKHEEIISDSEGNFNTSLELEKNENYIYARAIDASGNESQKSETQTVIFDTQPPVLEITTPSDNKDFYGSRQRQILIEGKSEENCKIQINNRLVIVESNGSFSHSVNLQEGVNNFNIKSEDIAGNTTETNLTVTFTP